MEGTIVGSGRPTLDGQINVVTPVAPFPDMLQLRLTTRLMGLEFLALNNERSFPGFCVI